MRRLGVTFMLMILTGCFSANPPFSSSPSGEVSLSEGIFPHKSDWKSPNQHGVYVKNQLNFDTTPCKACHGNSLEGGSGPSCTSCHTVYPHTSKGVSKDQHGAFVVSSGKAQCATACHGTDMKGGLSGVSCNQCHDSYPHADGWSTPNVHGPKAAGNQKFACTQCHGADWKGGTSGVSCVSCHNTLYPHPANWLKPEGHPAYVIAKGNKDCATLCHGVDLGGGLSGVNCKSCHGVWPHPEAWASQHGETARTIGINGCTSCHKQDPPGGKTGVDCTTCHTSVFDHQAIDWKEVKHGPYFLNQKDAMDPKTGCPVCHGADLSGGKKPSLASLKPTPACASCHDSYPNAHLGGNWKTAHGKFAGMSQCALCHGANVGGKAPTCNSCHASYPAKHQGAALWKTFEGHGNYVMSQMDPIKGNLMGQLDVALKECRLCHGQDLTGGSAQKGCYSCHSSFPHPVPAVVAGKEFSPWNSLHGQYYADEKKQGKPSTCGTANCHGLTLGGNPQNVEMGKKWVKGCADCHPMNHLEDNWFDPQDPFGGTHYAAVIQKDGNQLASCLGACHGTKGQGGTAKACTSCHAAYPHPWTDSGPDGDGYSDHGKWILNGLGTADKNDDTVNLAALEGCEKCHGANPPLNADQKLNLQITGKNPPNGATVFPCRACHVYPHLEVTKGGGIWPWKIRHSILINGWIQLYQPGNKSSFVAMFCGTSFMQGSAGCHTGSGPQLKGDTSTKSSKDECKFCHKP